MRFSAPSLLPAAFVAPNRTLQINRSHLSSIRSHIYMNDPTYTLNEDGDFAILGVNAFDISDDDAPSTGQPVGDLSSLLAGTTFSGLNGAPPQSSGQEATSNASSSSLNNDAMFGRIARSSMNDIRDSNKGSVIGENIGERGTDAQQHNQYARSRYVDQATLSEIQEWLLSIIPALNQQDAEFYSRGLDAIGFNPGCVTMSELQLEDLTFMKVLHRRYLFNEVTGNEHPWDV